MNVRDRTFEVRPDFNDSGESFKVVTSGNSSQPIPLGALLGLSIAGMWTVGDFSVASHMCYYLLFQEYLCHKKVQVGKDQEKAQSEKDSHSKNRSGKKPN